MMLRGIRRLRRAAEQIRNRIGRGALILTYHRIAEPASDPQLLCVAPQNFSEQLDILRKHFCPMRLQELAQAHRAGKLPNRALAVTFDDGYADNLYNAKPLLERNDIPATVFVATGSLVQDCELWWDELDRMFLQPGILPGGLRLTLNGSTIQYALGQAAHYNEETYRRHLRWNVEQKNNPSPRQELYRLLCRVLRLLPERKRRKALVELLAWSGAEPKTRRTHRTLSVDEVVDLTEGGLVEVGSHTVTHSVLSVLPTQEQWYEIQGSKTSLEEILGSPVNSFAYPYGSRSDYTSKTADLVEEAGFGLACSNFPGFVWRRTDRFQLPRVLVRDWDGKEFEHRMEEWFGGLI